MEIKQVVVKPFEDSILPAIKFEIAISHVKRQETIIDIEGWLESEDGKILARIGILPETKKELREIGARDSRLDSEIKETIHNIALLALLHRKSLSHIDNTRMGNVKRDVFLTLNLNIRSLVSKALVSHFHEIDTKTPRFPTQVNVMSSSGRRLTGKVLAYGHDSEYSTGYRNLWIISGDNSPVFLAIAEQNIRKEKIRIPSLDWIHDFEPKMGLGEYFIVEIPKGTTMTKAWGYVEKAEESLKQWNTKGAYANCRGAGDFLNKAVRKKFRNDPRLKKWKRAIEKFNKLTSTDLHEESIIEEEPKGEITIGRPETEHILIVTKALIKYAEELLQEKS